MYHKPRLSHRRVRSYQIEALILRINDRAGLDAFILVAQANHGFVNARQC
jgi:hypothetical protein